MQRYLLCTLLIFTIIPRDSFAQECPELGTSEENLENARRTFDEGQRLYELGNFTQALQMFECSYSLYAHQDTLYNIAWTYQSRGNLAAALRTYRRYVETYPQDSAVADINKKIRDIEARLSERHSHGEQTDNPQEETNIEVELLQEATSAGGELPQAGLSARVELLQEDELSPVTRMSTARIMAWSTLGLGLILGGIGSGFIGATASIHEDFDNALTEQSLAENELRDMTDRGQAFNISGWALLGIGAASLITSIVLFAAFDGKKTAEQSQARRSGFGLSPFVLENGGGFLVAGTL